MIRLYVHFHVTFIITLIFTFSTLWSSLCALFFMIWTILFWGIPFTFWKLFTLISFTDVDTSSFTIYISSSRLSIFRSRDSTTFSSIIIFISISSERVTFSLEMLWTSVMCDAKFYTTFQMFYTKYSIVQGKGSVHEIMLLKYEVTWVVVVQTAQEVVRLSLSKLSGRTCENLNLNRI